MQDACTDSSGKNDCLWRVKCNITGASCPKMDALFKQLDREQETKNMTNAKSTAAAATPKDVKEKVEEKTVPAQAQPNLTDGIADDRADKVLNTEGDVLFSGTPNEVRAWLNERPTTTYLVRSMTKDDKVVSMEYVEQKRSLMQRAKGAAEKLKGNKKAMLILAGAAVVVGLTIKNNRKAVTVTVEDEPEQTDESTAPDDTTDSL